MTFHALKIWNIQDFQDFWGLARTPSKGGMSAMLLLSIMTVLISRSVWCKADVTFPATRHHYLLPAALQRPEMTPHTFKQQLKAYLFHIWCVDEEKKHPPPPGAVVAFFVILAPDTKLPTYLLTYLPSSWYQIILPGDRGTCVWSTCPKSIYQSAIARNWTPTSQSKSDT